MARQKWTLALIIICLPILATVITAFRVRDLPKSLQNDLKTELKKHKCDNCDVNEVKVGHKLHSDKTESAKIKYEELKKAVREKQQLISQKASHKKPSIKLVVDNADDDTHDENLEFSNSESFSKEIKLKNPKVGHAQSLKKGTNIKIENVDDDDDDDDNDDEDNDSKEMLIKKHNILKKASSVQKSNIEHKTTKLFHKLNEDDDDGDDNSDDSKIKNKIPDQKTSSKGVIIQKSDHESKQKTKLEIPLVKKSYVGKEDNNENKSNKLIKSEPIKKNVESNKRSKGVKQNLISISLDDDDDDDDEDDDDGDEDDEDETVILSKSTAREGHVSKIKSGEKTLAIKQKVNDDDDDDDDDDEDEEEDEDGVFSSLFKKAQNLILLNTQEEQPRNQIKSEKKSVNKDEGKYQLQNTKQQIKTDTVKKEAKVKPVAKEHKELAKGKPEVHDTNSNEPAKPKLDSNKDEKKDKKETKTKDVTEKKHKEPDKGAVKQKPLEQKESKLKQQEELKKEKKSAETKNNAKPKSDQKSDAKDSSESLIESREILERHEKYLTTVNAALQRRNLLQSEFEDFYAFFPTFAPNFSRIHNPECRRHGQILLRQLRGTKLWALNMLDATAKIPSGILQGNGIQLGDFDQCLGSRARVQLDTGSVVKVQGRYCLARVDLRAEHPDLEVPVHLAQAKNLIKSRIDDPGHFVPRFSTLSWGVCLPSACDPEDVEVVIKDALKHYQHTTGLAIRVKVGEEDCHTQDGDWWDDWSELPTILTLLFYGVIILLVLIATIQDSLNRKKPDKSQAEEVDENAECDQKENNDEEEKSTGDKEQADGFLCQFSLYRTISKLVEPCTPEEISCIHGLRALATIALLVAHKFLPVAAMPYTNRSKITETVSSPLWSWCRAGWMYTDCFLLLSGTLLAHRMASGSDAGAPRRLFSRYLRLSPALLAVVLFYAYIWDNVSTGPMWGTLVTKNAELCQEGWWWNMLYVQNYFGFEEMCAPQTHQLALDFQLTILGGIIVWAVQVKERISWILMPTLHAIAAYSRYSTVQEHRLTLIAYHGVSVSQLYRTARLSYTSVLHRSTPYLVGLTLGMVLQKPSEHGKIFSALGWVTSASLWGLVWYAGVDSGATTYRYSAASAAQYAALAPLASALAIAWVIYAVHNGSFESLSRLLSCRPLLLISRLSYALYLCQFVVFLTQAATVRSSTEFSLMSLIDVQEIAAILLSSIILTITFVIPMQSLHKLFTFSSKKSSEEEEKAENESETDAKSADESKDDDVKVEEIEVPKIKSRNHFLAHREVLEEIPEVEVEFEMLRDRLEGLEEILEEEEAEEDEPGDDEVDNRIDDEDLEIIEEEQGEDDFWGDREEDTPRSIYSRQGHSDSNEWEWTSDGNGRSGAQYYRYSR